MNCEMRCEQNIILTSALITNNSSNEESKMRNIHIGIFNEGIAKNCKNYVNIRNSSKQR